jgi:hypothetical protein
VQAVGDLVGFAEEHQLAKDAQNIGIPGDRYGRIAQPRDGDGRVAQAVGEGLAVNLELEGQSGQRQFKVVRISNPDLDQQFLVQ